MTREYTPPLMDVPPIERAPTWISTRSLRVPFRFFRSVPSAQRRATDTDEDVDRSNGTPRCDSMDAMENDGRTRGLEKNAGHDGKPRGFFNSMMDRSMDIDRSIDRAGSSRMMWETDETKD